MGQGVAILQAGLFKDLMLHASSQEGQEAMLIHPSLQCKLEYLLPFVAEQEFLALFPFSCG